MQKMLPSYGVGLRENLGLSYSLICLLNGEVSVVFVSKGLVTRPFDDPSQRTGSLRSPPGSFGPTYRDASVCLGEGGSERISSRLVTPRQAASVWQMLSSSYMGRASCRRRTRPANGSCGRATAGSRVRGAAAQGGDVSGRGHPLLEGYLVAGGVARHLEQPVAYGLDPELPEQVEVLLTRHVSPLLLR